MDWKFGSAGRIICFRQTFLISALALSIGCGQSKPQQDPQLDQLRTDIRKLSEENQHLLKEIQALRKEREEKMAAAPQTSTSGQLPAQAMTLEQMKKEVSPILKDTIEKIKEASESSKNGKQFGMRVEYDLKNAVYGLVKTENDLAPYHAKVIVKFEKFLESRDFSRSYGNGSSTFVFAYRSGQWILQSYE